MRVFDVTLRMEKLRDQHRKWLDAMAGYREERDRILDRLILEAVKIRMSVADIARASGLSRKQVRDRMKYLGLHQRDGLRVMSDRAAENLRTNAALLGVDIDNFDLTSPLAYLPAGEHLQREMLPKVTELPGTWSPDVVNKALRSLLDRGQCVVLVRGEWWDLRVHLDQHDRPVVLLNTLEEILRAEDVR